MSNTLTANEQKLHDLLKRQFFLTSIKIRNKVSVKELCEERKDLVILFGLEYELIKDVIIDFVLYKDDKALAGIDIIDEPEELAMSKGEQLLIKTIFQRLGYEFFRIIDVKEIPQVSKIIARKVISIAKNI